MDKTPMKRTDMPIDMVGEQLAATKGLKKRRQAIVAPWEEIKALYCAGVSSEAIAKEYAEWGVKANTLRKRAEQQDWPTATNLRKKAALLMKEADEMDGKKIVESDNPVDVLARKMAENKITHQDLILEETNRQLMRLKESEKTLIRSAHDLELVDRVGRRTLGLDVADANSGMSINIQAFGGGPTPAPKPFPTVDV